jgi:hypothetical protein
MQDKTPINKEGKRHGHWCVQYNDFGEPFRAYYVNGVPYGLLVDHYYRTKQICKEYYAL